jgi:hypothetical protein
MDAGSDSGKNALTKAGLTELKEMEQKFMSDDEWPSRCALIYTDYPACQTPGIYNHVNPFWPEIKPDVTDPNGCILPNSPASLFAKYGDPEFDDIEGTIAKINATPDYASLVSYLDKDFSMDNKVSPLLKTIIFYGTPVHNSTYYMERLGLKHQDPNHFDYYVAEFIDEELTDINKYMTTFQPTLEKWYNDGNTPLTAYSFVLYNPMQDLVRADLSKIIVSILFVASYMWFSLGSFFMTFIGLTQIFCSFFGANLIYRFVWPSSDGYGYEYFTLFCGLAMFVIIGIGADDVFVYWDTWQASAKHPYKSTADRLSHVYGHAVNAMLVTSLTTTVSFLTNLSSAFIGVQTFGLFSALLVTVNFISVCTFFPASVLFYDKYVKETKFLFGIFDWIPKLFARKASKSVDAAAEDGAEGAEAEPEPAEEQPEKAFFKDTWAPFLDKYKYPILAFFALFIGTFAVGAVLITPTPLEIYTLFPPGMNFNTFSKLALTRFPGEANPLEIHLVFGLEVDVPVDYGDMKKTEFIPAGLAGETPSGRALFDRSFDIQDPVFQRQFLDTCNEVKDVLSPNADYRIVNGYGINPQLAAVTNGILDSTAANSKPYGIQCVMKGLEQFQDVNKVESNVDLGKDSYKDSVKYVFDGAPVVDGVPSWIGDDASAQSCRYCFDEFVISEVNDQNVFVEGVISNTSPVAKGCNCLGMFPIPERICLSEFEDLDDANPFKCQSSNMFMDSLTHYLQLGGNQAWWSKYVYAQKDDNNKFSRIGLTEITIQTDFNVFDTDAWKGMDMVHAWEEWAEEYNARYANEIGAAKLMVHCPSSPKWRQTILLAPAAISGVLVSLIISWVILCLSCENWILASLAMLVITCITVVVFGFLTFVGWGLGLLEGILVVLVIGFSVDYTVHLSDSYKVSKETTRYGKVREALDVTGLSILSGAVSTIGAAGIMLTANIAFFKKFGTFIFITIVLSTIFSLMFYSCLLIVFGPLGKAGRLYNLYGGFLKTASEHMEKEKEAAQKEADANKGVWGSSAGGKNENKTL